MLASRLGISLLCALILCASICRHNPAEKERTANEKSFRRVWFILLVCPWDCISGLVNASVESEG